jgi:hypothetical protein
MELGMGIEPLTAVEISPANPIFFGLYEIIDIPNEKYRGSYLKIATCVPRTQQIG